MLGLSTELHPLQGRGPADVLCGRDPLINAELVDIPYIKHYYSIE